ncbi:MAG: prolyl oligopeptidase family serine peptidase [Pseudomonadota bacterium]
MKLLKASAAAILVGVSALGLTAAAPIEVQAQASGASSVPIDVWALRNVVNAVQISPDGQHVLVHTVKSRDSDYLLQVYKTDDLTTPVRTINGDPMELITARWISNTKIFGSAWQFKYKTIKRQEQDPHVRASYLYDIATNKFSRDAGNFGLVNTLPNDPDHILIASGLAFRDQSGSDPLAGRRPANYYKMNLETGARRLILRGSIKQGSVVFDPEGNPRAAVGFDNGVQKYYFRRPGEGSWTLYDETDLNDQANLMEVFGTVGLQTIDPEDPSLGYVIRYDGDDDTSSLWELNLETGQFGKKLFQDPDADILGVATHSIPGRGTLAAAVYPGAKYERHWFDENEQALYEALEKQIPYAHQISITSRSVDGKRMIVENTGPHDPGSFWLVKDGQLAKLGSRNPLLNQENLADVEFIKYTSRDGMEIPAYLTKPKGEGPFPLVVLPHGGPTINEVIIYDEWSQMLASAGYMVLQPQYRISTGWGKSHFKAGLYEFGTKMQDDKDDGALYLVEQGLVDPDRIAMFGWSYGGYAALVSLSREEQVYQCAIAGAAVANYPKMQRERRGGIDIITEYSENSYGVNPMEEIPKVNIPLLMVHPRQDMRVRYFNFTDYKKEFEKAGKEGQFLTIEGANHFSNTLMYRHQQQLYTKMLDFLANDCGPGGL